MNYKNPIPVAIGLIPINGKLVAIRRGKSNIGGLAFPGGFVNEQESAETAVSREIKEEINIDLPEQNWYPICTKISKIKNILLVFLIYKGETSTDMLNSFVPNEEVTAIELIDKEAKLCFDLHQEVINEYYNKIA